MPDGGQSTCAIDGSASVVVDFDATCPAALLAFCLKQHCQHVQAVTLHLATLAALQEWHCWGDPEFLCHSTAPK